MKEKHWNIFYYFLFIILASHTNYTASFCSSTTCIGEETPYQSSIVTVLYPFDGNTNSVSGSSTGTLFGSGIPTVTNIGYNGQSLSVTHTSFQYAVIPSLQFAQTSFTLQMIIYPISLTAPTEAGIFGQCDTSSVCFAIVMRNGRIAVSLDSANSSATWLSASRILGTSVWIHVTIVYDATISQLRIYINGVIDAVSFGIVSPYQGVTSGATTTSGRVTTSSGFSYFYG